MKMQKRAKLLVLSVWDISDDMPNESAFHEIEPRMVQVEHAPTHVMRT